MAEVATELNIETETELFDALAKYGVSKVVYEFSYDCCQVVDNRNIEFEYNDDETEIPEEIEEAIETLGDARAHALADGDYSPLGKVWQSRQAIFYGRIH